MTYSEWKKTQAAKPKKRTYSEWKNDIAERVAKNKTPLNTVADATGGVFAGSSPERKAESAKSKLSIIGDIAKADAGGLMKNSGKVAYRNDGGTRETRLAEANAKNAAAKKAAEDAAKERDRYRRTFDINAARERVKALQEERKALQSQYAENARRGQSNAAAHTDALRKIDNKISAINADIYKAEKVAEADRYNAVPINADYTEKSKATANLFASSDSGDALLALVRGNDKEKAEVLHDYINGADYAIEAIKKKDRTQSKYGDQYRKYGMMTNDEVSIYNYLYNTKGYEEATKYLSHIEETLNARLGQQIAGGMNDAQKVALGVNAGLDNFNTGIKQMFTEDVKPTTATQYAGQTARENLGKGGQFAYDFAQLVGNMAPSILLSTAMTAVGGAAGIGALASAAPVVGSASMGMSAYGNAYADMMQRTGNKEKSKAYAALVGASESTLSYLLSGISALGGKAVSASRVANAISSIGNIYVRTAAEFAKAGISEGVEETLQEYLEPMFYSAVFGGDYEAPEFKDAARTFLLAALSGGMFEGGNIVSSEIATVNNMYKEMYKEPADLEILVDKAFSLNDTKATELATAIQQKVEAGEDVSGAEIRKLAERGAKVTNARGKAAIRSQTSADAATAIDFLVRKHEASKTKKTGLETAAQEMERKTEGVRRADAKRILENPTARDALKEYGYKVDAEDQVASVRGAIKAMAEAGIDGKTAVAAVLKQDAKEAPTDSATAEGNAPVPTADTTAENIPAEGKFEGNTEVMENGEGNLHLRYGSERNDGADSSVPVRSMEESAGRDSGGEEIRSGPRDEEAANVTPAKKVKGSAVIEGGIDNDLYLYEYTATKHTRKAKEYADARGLKLVLFGGDSLKVMQDDRIVSAKGAIRGDTIYVRVDHPDFTADQIALHEITHDKINKGEISVKAVRDRINDLFKDPAELEQLVEMYISAYHGSKADEMRIFEEIICDAEAGLNEFVGTLKEESAQKLLENTRIATEENIEERRTRGPPMEVLQHMADVNLAYDAETDSVSMQFSEELDREYLSLAKDPVKNAAKLQEMVDAAAKKAGYTVKAYHGTPNKGFTKFNYQKIGSTTDSGIFGRGFYFTTHKGTADGYATASGETMAVNLKLKNPWWAVAHRDVQETADKLGMSESALLLRTYGGRGKIVAPIESQAAQFSAHLAENGYDSIVIQHGNGDYEIVVFDNKAIKSAAPVTYDDNGNIIPLSERFNPKEEGIRFSEDINVPNKKEKTDVITIGMSDSERTKILSKKVVKAPVYLGEADDLIERERSTKSEERAIAKDTLLRIAEEFGVLGKLDVDDIDVQVMLSKKNLRESAYKGANEEQTAKLLPVLRESVKSAIGIEAHENRYFYDETTSYFSELLGAYVDGNNIIPIRYGLKHIKDGQNVLYIVVDQPGFAIPKQKNKTGVVEAHPLQNGVVRTTRPVYEISIPQIAAKVNSKDILRYLPDNFLTEGQREIKWTGIADTITYTNNKNDEKYLGYIRKGNFIALESMVREAAKAAEYDYDAYHGTNQGDFRMFDWEKTQRADGGFYGRGHYFTKAKSVAEQYGNRIVKVKLKLGKTFVWSDEVNSYKGKQPPELLSRNIVSRINMAKIFPDIFANKVMSYWEYDPAKDDNVQKNIKWSDLENIVNKLSDGLTLTSYADGSYRWHTEGRFWEVPVGERYASKAEAEAGKFFAAINALKEKYDGLLSSLTFDDQTTYTQEYGSEITEALKEMGYQSAMDTPEGGEIVVFDSNRIKSADPITYDENDNVIPISERFNDENDDMYFSEELTALSDLRKDNERLRKQLAHWRNEVKATDKPTVRRDDVEKLSRRLVRDYHLTVTAEEVTNIIEPLANLLAKNEDVTWNQVRKIVEPAARQMIEGAEVLNDEAWKHYADLRNYLKDHKFTLTAEEASSIPDFMAWKKANRKYLSASIGNTNVDNIYSEMSDRWPEFFNENREANPADQLLQIVDTLERITPIYENPYDFNISAATEYLADDIMDSMISPDIRRVKTYADRANEKLKAAKQKRIDDLRKKTQSANARAMRDRIIRHSSKLYQDLGTIRKDRNIPEELRAPVAAVLDAINFESKHTVVEDENGRRHVAPKGVEGEPTKRTKKFEELQDVYRDLAEKGQLVIDPNILGIKAGEGTLDAVIKMRDKRLDEMNVTELQMVWDVIRSMEQAITNWNKAFRAEKAASISSLADTIHTDNFRKTSRAEYNRVVQPLLKLVEVDNLTPEAYFHRIGKVGDSLFRMLRNAQDEHINILAETTNFLAEIIKDENIRKLDRSVRTIKLGGSEVKVTVSQLMELFALCNRPHALMHILTGGIRLDTMNVGKLKLLSNREVIRNITESELRAAFEKLSEQEKKIIIALQKYASTKLSEYGNKATMEVYGVKKFTEENYWPIRTHSNDTNQEAVAPTDGAKSVENYGMAQQVKPDAKTSLRVGSLFDTFSNHSVEMATYASYLAPMLDLNRIRNYKFDGVNVKDSLNRAVGRGDQGSEYLSTLMKDLSVGISSQNPDIDPLAPLLGNYKAASVAANLRVVMQQPTAGIRAMSMINPKYFINAKLPTKKKWNDVIKKYAPIAQWKDWGYFDVHTGRQIKDVFFGTDSALEKAKQTGMWLAGKMDSITWGIIWNACENEVADTHKDLNRGTDAFYKKVAERFNEVIDHTQVVDGILQRSQIMRAPSTHTKIATAFLSEPTKQLNMAASAIYDFANATSKSEKSAAAKRLFRTATFLCFAGFVNGTLGTSLIDGLRDDDEEKNYFEKVLAAATGLSGDEESFGDFVKAITSGNLFDQFNIVSMIPYANNVWSAAQGFTGSDLDDAALEDLMTAIRGLIKSNSGESKKSDVATKLEFVGAIATLFGLPVNNLKREVVSFTQTFVNEFGNSLVKYRYAKLMMNPSENKKAFLAMMYDAYKNDKDAYEVIRKDLLREGFTEEDLDGGIKSGIKTAFDLSGYVEDKAKKNNYLYSELEKLGGGKAANVMPDGMAPVITYKDDKDKDITVQLDENEYAKFQKDVGDKAFEILKNTVGGAKWKSMTNDEKKSAISYAYQIARAYGKQNASGYEADDKWLVKALEKAEHADEIVTYKAMRMSYDKNNDGKLNATERNAAINAIAKTEEEKRLLRMLS